MRKNYPLLFLFLILSHVGFSQATLELFIGGQLQTFNTPGQTQTVNYFVCDFPSGLQVEASGWINSEAVNVQASNSDSAFIISQGVKSSSPVMIAPQGEGVVEIHFRAKVYFGTTLYQSDSFIVKYWNHSFFPAPSFSQPTTQYACAGTMGFVSLDIDPNYPALEYIWSDGGTTNSSRILPPGTYTVQGHMPGNLNCMTPASLSIEVYDISLWDRGISSEGSLNLCPGGSVSLSANTTPPTGTRTWSNGQTGSFIDVNSPGNYSYTWTDPNTSCVFQSDVVTVTQVTVPVPTISTSKLTLCPGETTELFASGSGAYTGFLWSDETRSASLITGSANTYKVKGIIDGCESDWSAEVTVTMSNNCSANVWNGTGSWTQTANWSKGTLPTDTSRVIVNSGSVEFNSVTSLSFKSLEIKDGAEATVPGTTIQLKEYCLNDGILTEGTLNFLIDFTNPIDTHRISGSGQTRIEGIQIFNGTPAVHTGTTLRVKSMFDIIASKFKSSGLVVLDNQGGSSPVFFGPNAAGSFNGTIEYIRHFRAADANTNGAWMLMASPIDNLPLNLLQANGSNPFASGTFDLTQNTNSSLYTYDPTNNLVPSNQGYTKLSNPASTFEIGKGYRTWFNLGMFNTGGRGKSRSISFQGSPFSGNKTIPLSYCVNNCPYSTINGWNLIGNPFPSNIYWGIASDYIETNVSPTIHTFISSNNTWATYLRGVGGVNGGTGYVKPGEGFFVEATGPGASLTIKSDASYTYWSTEDAPAVNTNISGKLRAKLVSGGKSDEVMVVNNTVANKAYDVNEDAKKIFGGSVSLAIETSGPSQSIAQWTFSPIDTIWLSVSAQQAGNYQFRFETEGNFDQASYYLADPQTGMITPVNAGQDIPLFADAQTRRIALFVVNPTVSALPGFVKSDRMAVYPNPASGFAELQLDEVAAEVWVTDVAGKRVMEIGKDLRGTRFSVADLKSGIYMVNARMKSGILRQKLSVQN